MHDVVVTFSRRDCNQQTRATPTRFRIMEAIWEDLRDRFERSDVPQEHKDLLDLRRARIASGEAQLLAWDEVKGSIGRG